MVHHWQSIVYPTQGVRGIVSPQSVPLCRLRPPSKLQRILGSSTYFDPVRRTSSVNAVDAVSVVKSISFCSRPHSTIDLLKPSIVALSQSMLIVVCYCLRKCLSSNSIGLKMNFQAITKNSFEKGLQ